MKSMKIASLIKMGVGAIFVLVPLAVFPQFLYPLTAPKIIVFQSLTEIVFILWLVNIFVNGQYKPRLTPLTIVIFCLLAIVTFTSLIGVDFQKSLWDVIDRNTGLVLLWHLFALFLVIKSLGGEIDFKWFAGINVATSALISFLALVQKFIGWPVSLFVKNPFQIYSTFSNSSFLAAYLMVVLFLGLYLLTATKNVFLRWVVSLISILNLIVILFTGTRSVIIALLAGGIILALYFIVKRGRVYRLTVAIIAVIFLGVAISFLLTKNNPFWLKVSGISRFASSSLVKNLENRLVLWEIAWEAFKERPVSGWGWNNFDVAFWKHYNAEQYENQINYFYTAPPNKPFNVLFEYLVSAGILGLLGYLAVFVLAFFNVIKDRLAAAPFIISLLVAYFVNNLAIFDTIATYPLFFGLLALIDTANKNLQNSSQKRVSKTILTSAILIGLLLVYFVNGRFAYAARQQYFAHRDASLNHWQKAINTLNPYTDHIRYDYAVWLRQAFDKDVKENWDFLHQDAINKLKNLAFRHPQDAQFYLELGNAYNSFSAFDKSYPEKGEEALERALALAPVNAKIYIALAKNKLLQKDVAGALDDLNKMVRLHSGLSRPQVLLAILYYQIGDENQSYLEIKNAIKEGALPVYAEENMIFGDILADFGDYEQAIEFYKRVLTERTIAGTEKSRLPFAVNASLKIGLAYNLIGETEKSKEILENLADLLAGIEPVAYQQIVTVLDILGF